MFLPIFFTYLPYESFFFMIESWNWNTSKSLVILCWWDHIIPFSKRWVVSRDGKQQNVTLAMESREKPIPHFRFVNCSRNHPDENTSTKKMNVRFAVIVFYKIPPKKKHKMMFFSLNRFIEKTKIPWALWHMLVYVAQGNNVGVRRPASPVFEKSSPKKDPEVPGPHGSSPECDARDIRGTGWIVTWMIVG